MKFLKKRIKGIGWQGLIIELANKDTFELTNLIQANPKKYPFFLESSSRGNNQNSNSIMFYNLTCYITYSSYICTSIFLTKS